MIATTFTLDGIKYTVSGPSLPYSSAIDNVGSTLGGGSDYFLWLDSDNWMDATSVKIEAADGSAFRLASLSFDSSQTISITPQGGSAVPYVTPGVMQNVSFASNPGFNNITSFTISGANLRLKLDDLNFEAPLTPPAITSAIYDATTHQLVVTGTNFVSSGGVNDDVVVSQLTLTGQGGSYGLTSGNVEITDASHFTVTLNATDIINVNGVLNKNGTSAVSAVTYNIAGAAGFIAANASDADLTGYSKPANATGATWPTSVLENGVLAPNSAAASKAYTTPLWMAGSLIAVLSIEILLKW